MENLSPLSRASKRAIGVYALLGVAFLALILSFGDQSEILDRLIAIVFTLLNSAWIPMLYLVGAFGLGRIARRWTGSFSTQCSTQFSTRWVIELCVGLTITLTLTHALGVLGFLNPVSAWLVTGSGCAVVFLDRENGFKKLSHTLEHLRLSISGGVFVLGCVLVIAMSCVPPGVSWDSEFGGYDSLSYHLELPREWLESGRIWPSEHNVYSFLPSYIESAYLHFAHLGNAPTLTGSGLSGLLAHEARITMSAHLFSAMLLIVSALGIRSVTARAIALYIPRAETRLPALCAQAVLMCTPWLTLVGSVAYNEMGVVLLGIGAFAVVIEHESSPARRSMLSAFLLGGACGCKPTALFLLAPSVIVVLFCTVPVRHWLKPIGFGIVVGLLTLAPWLIRNELATGSVVFPQFSSLFGSGHWSEAQHTLYNSAHRFDGSLSDRISMLLLPDPSGTGFTSTYRGFTNHQWAFVPIIGSVGCLVLLLQRRTRTLGLISMLALVLPILGWYGMTHLQSRFLIPMAPALIIVGAMALATSRAAGIQRAWVAILSLSALIWTTIVVSIQLNANPFITLVLGSKLYSGEIDTQDGPWSATINSLLEPRDLAQHETVYLLGDSAPFYVRSPMIYNTVYDRWLIEDVIESHPNAPEEWSSALRELGVDIVVVSFAEISRFERSGWLPETINADELIEWTQSLPEPIYSWTVPNSSKPIRAMYRLPQ